MKVAAFKIVAIILMALYLVVVVIYIFTIKQIKTVVLEIKSVIHTQTPTTSTMTMLLT